MHERGGIRGAVEQDFNVILATLSAVVTDTVREAGSHARFGGDHRAG